MDAIATVAPKSRVLVVVTAQTQIEKQQGKRPIKRSKRDGAENPYGFGRKPGPEPLFSRKPKRYIITKRNSKQIRQTKPQKRVGEEKRIAFGRNAFSRKPAPKTTVSRKRKRHIVLVDCGSAKVLHMLYPLLSTWLECTNSAINNQDVLK
jgi:hypothetical protein